MSPLACRWKFAAVATCLVLASAAQPAPARKDARPQSTPKPRDSATPAPSPARETIPVYAPNVSLSVEELAEFRAQPAAVKKLIESSLDLARQNLTYIYGSADPANGGLDCSGFIYYVLRLHGFAKVPRDSSGQYTWVREAHAFRAVLSRQPDTFEFDELLPGDLLFWTGTYATDRDPPISHVMIFLGTEKATGARVMIGSSDGRSYRGQRRYGVSVFDFVMPRKTAAGEQRATFVGYARIPGLRD